MSIINDIEIKNFKSIRHQKIEGCKRINVFVGEPNVGKSNILEALSLMTLANERFINLKDLCRFGTLIDVFNDGDNQKAAVVITDDKIFALHYIDENQLDYRIANSNTISNNSFKTEDSLLHLKIDNLGKTSFFPSNLKEVPFKQVRKYKFIGGDFTFKENAKVLNTPFGKNLFFILRYNNYLRQSCGEFFRKYNLKMIFEKDNNLKIQKQLDEFSEFQFPFFQIADTLQRLFFHKAAIESNQNSVLLFEEPEANCYEPYIMEITNAIKNDKNENQFFMVTHSQYVIDELMRDEESRNDTNIYLVGLENNETKIKLLSAEASKDAYQTGLNLFFNYQTLWDEN